MKNSFLTLFIIWTLMITSCQEPEYCDIFNHQYPSFILVNVLDNNNNQNLLFGNNASLSLDELDIQIKTKDGNYTSVNARDVLNNQDSVLLISLVESFSPDLNFPITNELIINYNNQFTADTINIEYVEGDCKDGYSVAYDYNLTLNTENFCALCFNQVINILK